MSAGHNNSFKPNPHQDSANCTPSAIFALSRRPAAGRINSGVSRDKENNMTIWKYAVLILALVPAASAKSDGTPSLQGMLAISKMAGACGILQQMSAFQGTTKLENGDAFIQRFWSTEAARLGKTPEEYIATCNSTMSAYEKLWLAAEDVDGA